MALHPFDLLRLQHIIPPSSPMITFQGDGIPTNIGTNVNEQGMNFTPEHDAADRFTKALDAFPKEHKPGLLRKLGAIAAGTLGADTEETLHLGRAREIEDWKTQIGPLGQAAGIERQSNANLMGLQHQTEETKRKIQADIERDKNTDERETRLGEQFTQSGVLKKELADTLAKSKTDLTELEAKHAKERADALAESHRLISEASNKSREGIAAAGNTSKETIATGRTTSLEKVADKRIQATSGKPESASNQATRYRTNAETLVRTDPTGLGKFIKVNPNNPKGFDIVSAGGAFSKVQPTAEERKKINDYINNTGAFTSTGEVKKDSLGLFKK